jgi:hypothetical protein
MNLAVPFALFAVAAAPANAQRRSDPCRRGGDETACFVARQPQWLGVYGLASAASHVEAGAEIRRAMFIDGYDRDTVAVEFRRAPGSGPQVAIYLPRGTGEAGRAEPALTGAVPLADWEELERRSLYFDRRLVPAPEPRSGEGDETITVCTHAWTYAVEYTDPAQRSASRRLRRRVENACDGALTGEYATLLSDVAARLLPGCAALDRRLHRNNASLLNVCARFSGDRAAAAMVYNRIGELRGGGRADHLPLLRSLFAPGARLEWNGELIERRVAEAWLARTSDADNASYFTRRLHGESAQRVREEGVLQRWRIEGDEETGRSVLWSAPVELVWTLHLGTQFRIAEARVGAFERVDDVCASGSLTGLGIPNNCRR